VGIIIRQSVKTTIVTYIGILIGTLNVLGLMAYFLESSQIGMIYLLTNLSIFLVFVAQLGVPYIAIKFFPQYREPEKGLYGFLFFLLVVPLVGFIIFGGIFYFFKEFFLQFFEEQSAEFLPYAFLVLPMALLLIYINVFEAYARNKLRIVVPGIVRQVMLRVMIASVVLIYAYLSLGFGELLNLYVLIHGIALLVLIGYVILLGDFKLQLNLTFFRKEKLFPMITFGAFSIAGGLGSLMVTRIDVIMLGVLAGMSNTGVYTIALFVATVIEIPKRAIGQISSPIIAEALLKNDLDTVKSIYYKSSLNQFLVGSLLFILIWTNVDNIFAIIPRSEIYEAGKWVVFWIGLSKLISMVAGISDQILINSKYYKYNFLFIAILGVLAIITNLWLIPIYGISGAAIATALSISLFNITRVLFILARFKLQPLSRGTWMVLFVGGITYGLNLIMPEFSNTLLDLVLRLSFLSVCFGGLSFWLRISPELNDMALSLFRKI